MSNKCNTEEVVPGGTVKNRGAVILFTVENLILYERKEKDPVPFMLHAAFFPSDRVTEWRTQINHPESTIINIILIKNVIHILVLLLHQ